MKDYVTGNKREAAGWKPALHEIMRGWYYSADYRQACQVIEVQHLWEETICRVWLADSDRVVRVRASSLITLDQAGVISQDHIAYVAAAGRVVQALTQDLLLAPIGSTVIPLPHQIQVLSRAVSGDEVRYLLADEVGLGKTIEAGLILRELKLRGLVKRILVVAPKGLVSQWVSEMHFHFQEHFQLILPEDIKTLRRIQPVDVEEQERGYANTWQMFSQVVVPMDSVKPLDKRQGWSASQLGDYNRERFEDLVSAGWDLVIVDEAHRLGGSSEQVARFKLGRGLADAAPYFLLLSATPHQGKSDAFHRLLTLIDDQEFSDVSTVTRDRVQPYVIRTEKRCAIDSEGKPLFKPRRTQLAPVSWEERHRSQQLLYEAVSEYVREGYNRAMAEKQRYIGFLMILMQRLVVSSTSAIRSTLKRRYEALDDSQGQMMLFPDLEEEWADLDGQEQVDMLLASRFKALQDERAQVKVLLDAAARCEQQGPDAKAEALLDWLYRLQAEEGDPELKVLVFTEFVSTQTMLHTFLKERGFSVVCLNGGMDMEERREVQEAFSKKARILISTDAGGEGLNLQFCHVVVNYDIPWNPMRLEQRIGRVDRIGQKHAVRAVNFVFESSVEHRVREVLEEKLAVIFEEFGVDKTSDVLDSEEAAPLFDGMFVEALVNPDGMEASVTRVVERLQEQVREAQASSSVLGAMESLDTGEAERLQSHPMPHWVEWMTVNYLNAHGGTAEKQSRGWKLVWPDGVCYEKVVFSGRDAERNPSCRQLTLEDPRIRQLITRLPRFVPDHPIPIVTISGLSTEIQGLWSLWRIAIAGLEEERRRILALFLADNDKVYMPTARHIWECLLMAAPTINGQLTIEASNTVFEKVRQVAEEHGRSVYKDLLLTYQERLDGERDKTRRVFARRRESIEKIGLPQVRNYRLKQLMKEEALFQDQIAEKAEVYPDMIPLLLMRVGGEKNG